MHVYIWLFKTTIYNATFTPYNYLFITGYCHHHIMPESTQNQKLSV